MSSYNSRKYKIQSGLFQVFELNGSQQFKVSRVKRLVWGDPTNATISQSPNFCETDHESVYSNFHPANRPLCFGTETGLGLGLWLGLGLVFVKVKRAVCWMENSANLMNREKP